MFIHSIIKNNSPGQLGSMENLMEFEVRLDCEGVNWQRVSETLESVGMAHHGAEKHEAAFKASHTTVFIYHKEQLVGFGRALSDGVYQAAVYDVAVANEFQGQGLGRIIMDNILSRVSHCNIILYASPGKEGFYEKQQFRRMKTGMARFTNREAMIEKGFTE